MLVAEIHGKVVPEVLNSEDFLTSAVFGHLRYLPPNLFWPELFHAAKSLPDPNGIESSLGDSIISFGSFTEQTVLAAHFWSRHPKWGEPDLLLHFSNQGLSVYILIEIKLWAGKSGKDDQLVRYLNLLDDIPAILPWTETNFENSQRYVIYLTPHESLGEIQDSFSKMTPERQLETRPRVFRLQWQDVAQVADLAASSVPQPSRTILEDVALFLQKRGLEYFNGFKECSNLDVLEKATGHFYRQPSQHFYGWTEAVGLDDLKVYKGEWNR